MRFESRGGMMNKRLCAAVGVGALVSLGGAARADGLPTPLPSAFSTSQWEFGARYWYSEQRTKLDLFAPGFGKVSALTWDGQSSNSGELFFRGDIWHQRVFVKGFLGMGGNDGGKLIDEDFPPLTVPYSRTVSIQREGALRYADIDVGYSFYNSGLGYGGVNDGLPVPRLKLGGFAGYFYLNDTFGARGCTQVATNPFICVPSIPTNVEVDQEDLRWDALRIGLNGEVNLTNRLKFSAEVAYLPYVSLSATDHHELRPTINPVPIDGTGDGVQAEILLSYQLTNAFGVGVGGRWWHLETDKGNSHFEQTFGGGIPQGTKFHEDRAGVFFQGSLKFDTPDPILR
jgi:hypothetical protein